MAKMNTEEFIRRATLKHDEKYDYSKSVYFEDIDRIILDNFVNFKVNAMKLKSVA